MDPSSIINEAAASSYNLAEIWQFPLSGAESTGRRQDLAGLVEMGTGGRGVSVDDSTVTEYSGKKRRDHGGGGGGRGGGSEDDSSELNESNGKRVKASGRRNENGDCKNELEASSGGGNNNKPAEQSNQPSEAPKLDYIHVRARRGQATDSHSLAERARREKISERMKILQDLVPGCNKVIGKAMVLDEIINYIQSLQRQVEFLSMKLEAVNSRVSPSIDGFPPKDFGAQPYDAAGMPFAPQPTREYGQGSAPEWLHMQVGSGFERST